MMMYVSLSAASNFSLFKHYTIYIFNSTHCLSVCLSVTQVSLLLLATDADGCVSPAFNSFSRPLDRDAAWLYPSIHPSSLFLTPCLIDGLWACMLSCTPSHTRFLLFCPMKAYFISIFVTLTIQNESMPAAAMLGETGDAVPTGIQIQIQEWRGDVVWMVMQRGHGRPRKEYSLCPKM